MISGFKSNSRITAKDCEANASFNSINSISFCFKPACCKAFGMALIGQAAGQEVQVETQAGVISYKILEIQRSN